MRRLYGRYGEASGVDPAICWPVKEELEEAIEYEQVAYPFTIPHMIAEAKRKRHETEESVKLRQEEIVKKMEKIEQMKQDVYNRIKNKETEAKAAKVVLIGCILRNFRKLFFCRNARNVSLKKCVCTLVTL